MKELKLFGTFACIPTSFRLSVGCNARHCALHPHGNLFEIKTKSHESNL